MIKLYEYPPTRSQRAKWALEELGIAYSSHVVNLQEGQQDSDAYRALHPLGVVPALETDGYTIFESVAIVLQLIDEHPEKNLAPAIGTPERASYYQWSVFACAELDPSIMMFFDNTMRPLEHMRPLERNMTRSSLHVDAAISRSVPAYCRRCSAIATICLGPISRVRIFSLAIVVSWPRSLD